MVEHANEGMTKRVGRKREREKEGTKGNEDLGGEYMEGKGWKRGSCA